MKHLTLNMSNLVKGLRPFEVDAIRDIAKMTLVLSGIFIFYVNVVVTRLSTFPM